MLGGLFTWVLGREPRDHVLWTLKWVDLCQRVSFP